ncbi:sensor histidine kinase [Shewanella sedimentimangrovi]|uniref:Histidine kinase n=1 Tax=Shewanella sedimentimangrovi TaxID=2814293 RepID=A0ABX7R164_9GAMM|nr:histidine kinase [Shewanella sedimentimangrovi]QSX36605.1 histidine kinase [Shewanella sedimentimangrovi]
MKPIINITILFAFANLMVLYSALLQGGSSFVYHPDAPVWIFLQCLLAQGLTLFLYRSLSCRRGNQPFELRHFFAVLVASNISFVLLSAVLSLGVELLFGLQQQEAIHIVLMLLMSFILHLVVGGFTLAFKAFVRANQQQVALQASQKSLAMSQLKMLQQQIDPHFLFNNLNVLSALIQRNPMDADEFLNAFCEIYRYVMQSQDKTYASLAQELAFAEDYMHLLGQRFQHAYRLQLEVDPKMLERLIVPCALQLALENVTKHNQANHDDPMLIRIFVEDEHLVISNPIREKPFRQPSNGIGLNNLSQRYLSVFDKNIGVKSTAGQFSLSLPLMTQPA